eukprot:327218-Chlamydomonas_euryale.AAC.3
MPTLNQVPATVTLTPVPLRPAHEPRPPTTFWTPAAAARGPPGPRATPLRLRRPSRRRRARSASAAWPAHGTRAPRRRGCRRCRRRPSRCCGRRRHRCRCPRLACPCARPSARPPVPIPSLSCRRGCCPARRRLRQPPRLPRPPHGRAASPFRPS